jgi:monothiol glutaredoxin
MNQPDVQKYIAQLVANHKVLLFMKGNKTFPQCGFSAAVVEVLKRHGVPFETVNVLQDPGVREGIKQFSSWPTIPQLYINGEFIGGCDIVREMDASGELAEKLSSARA